MSAALGTPSSVFATARSKIITVNCAAVAGAANYKFSIVGDATWSHETSAMRGRGFSSFSEYFSPGSYLFTARAISASGVEGALSAPSSSVTVASGPVLATAADAAGTGEDEEDAPPLYEARRRCTPTSSGCHIVPYA